MSVDASSSRASQGGAPCLIELSTQRQSTTWSRNLVCRRRIEAVRTSRGPSSFVFPWNDLVVPCHTCHAVTLANAPIGRRLDLEYELCSFNGGSVNIPLKVWNGSETITKGSNFRTCLGRYTQFRKQLSAKTELAEFCLSICGYACALLDGRLRARRASCSGFVCGSAPLLDR